MALPGNRFKYYCPQCNDTVGGVQKQTAEMFAREHKQEPGHQNHTPRVLPDK